MPRSKTKKIKVEENLQKLETIVKKFERGKIGMEESISEYEKAAKLIKNIKKELTSLSLKIEQIRDSY